MFARLVTIAITLTLTLAKQCTTYPNYETEAYTYTVCNGTNVSTLNTSREFCQEEVEGGDVVTFANSEEYDFIISKLNETLENPEDFRYFVGIFQPRDDERYNPETGDYFWVDAPNTKITADSETHWKPIAEFILDFDNHNLGEKQIGTFVLDINGKWYTGESVAGGASRTSLENGEVICINKGVPQIATPSTPAANTTDESLELWIIIVAAVGVLILGIILALIAYCVFKKMKNNEYNNDKKQSFQPVPQNDNQEVNGNGAPSKHSAQQSMV